MAARRPTEMKLTIRSRSAGSRDGKLDQTEARFIFNAWLSVIASYSQLKGERRM